MSSPEHNSGFAAPRIPGRLPAPEDLYALAKRYYPLCRSITGEGVRASLDVVESVAGPLRRVEIPTGTRCHDWVVPDEWNIRAGHIETPSGEVICDFAQNNLHVMGYSVPVNATVDRDELDAHLHSDPSRPDDIVYATSYYRRDWGFCIPHSRRQALGPGKYKVVIDATLAPGALSIGELVLPGDSDEEVFVTTYTCHPSMANNETSGPTVLAFLAAWLRALPRRRFTYRMVFAPETIGAIAYLAHTKGAWTPRVRAAFTLSCIGDERTYSYVAPRKPGTVCERAVHHVLEHMADRFVSYSYLDRGSDERQYGAAGVDLPMVTLCRSKFGMYPEYHTSADDFSVVTPGGLWGGFMAIAHVVWLLENDARPKATVRGEPQLGTRGLYDTNPTAARMGRDRLTWLIRNVVAYADGATSLLDMAALCDVPFFDVLDAAHLLRDHGLVVLS